MPLSYNPIATWIGARFPKRFVADTLAKYNLDPQPVENFETYPDYWWSGGNNWSRVIERYTWGAIIFGRAGAKQISIAVCVAHVDPKTGLINGISQDGTPYSTMIAQLSPVFLDVEERAAKRRRPPAIPECFGFHEVGPTCDGGITGAQLFEPKCVWRRQCAPAQEFLIAHPDVPFPTDSDGLAVLVRTATELFRAPSLPKVNVLAAIRERNAPSVVDKRQQRARSFVFLLAEEIKEIMGQEYVAPELAEFGDLIKVGRPSRFHYTFTISLAGIGSEGKRFWPVKRSPIHLVQARTLPGGRVNLYLREQDPAGWVLMTNVKKVQLEKILKIIKADVLPKAKSVYSARLKVLQKLRGASKRGRFKLTSKHGRKGGLASVATKRQPDRVKEAAANRMQKQIEKENW